MGLLITGFKKVGLLNRFFTRELYTAADMEKAYSDGQLSIGNSVLTTHIDITKHNNIINKLEIDINTINNINSALQDKLDKSLSELNTIKSEKVDLTKKVSKINSDLFIKKDTISSYINEIKILNTAIADLKQKHSIEINKVLKDCANNMLKQDRIKVSTQPDPVTKYTNVKKLTCVEVNDIRTSNLIVSKLATKYNISKSAVYRIKNKETCKDC